MRIDVDTSIGTFEDIERFSILKGEKFVLRIVGELAPDENIPRWASFNDPVLDIRDGGLLANVEATKAGDAEIWLTSGDNPVKKLFITVTPPKDEAVTAKVTVTEEPLT